MHTYCAFKEALKYPDAEEFVVTRDPFETFSRTVCRCLRHVHLTQRNSRLEGQIVVVDDGHCFGYWF